jgi:arylsulfatase A-like enzyme
MHYFGPTSVLVALLVMTAVPGTAASRSARPSPPNVLLITVDTLRADHLSCYGYYLKTSPNIDRLAQEGVRFEKAYTVIPLTGPAHFSLLTSRFPQEHGARINGLALAESGRWLSLPQVLRKNGYQGAAFVSAWPLTSRLTHLDRWFDQYDENLTRRYQVFNSSRYAEDVTPVAVSWLKRHTGKRKPFFLWVHYFDPHSPYEFRTDFSPRETNGTSSRPLRIKDEAMLERIRDYDSEIVYTDNYIGRLLATLDELNLRESTLVVLTADHGESLGEHDYVGHGRQLFESTIRIPLIMRLPGKVNSGAVIDTPVSLLDVAPTIADFTVARLPKYNKAPIRFHGRSLAAAIRGDEQLPERRIRFLTFAGKKGFIPSWLSWLWVEQEQLPLRMGLSNGASKVIWTPSEDRLAFYDTRTDPLETRPRLLRSGNAYDADTTKLKRWFSLTAGRAGENQMSTHDMEVLKSLGYLQ